MLRHLEFSYQDTVLRLVSRQDPLGLSSIHYADQYKLLLCILFAHFPFKWYNHEQLNRLQSIGIKNGQPLQPEMIKLLRKGEKTCNSFQFVATELVNWCAVAQPVLSSSTFDDILNADTYENLRKAINLVPMTTMVRSSICFHKQAHVRHIIIKLDPATYTCESPASSTSNAKAIYSFGNY